MKNALWKRAVPAFAVLLLLLALPYALRPTGVASVTDPKADRLVVITAHNEAIRYEYEHAFRRYYQARFGRDVAIDWRSPGGTNDIMRYVADRYEASFRALWEADPANGPWDDRIKAAFANPAVERDPRRSEAEKRARRLFLASSAGIGIDVMAGGGTFELERNAVRGFAVDGGVQRRHPEYFRHVPEWYGGSQLYDPQGRYYGIVLSTFGICYNFRRLAGMSDPRPPLRWSDLGDGKYFNTLSLADPTKSGSANKCYEIIVQQQMAEAGDPVTGWARGVNLLKRIFANARSLTDSAGKIPRDVAAGDAAAGMAIDTYGRTEEDWSARCFEGQKQLRYLNPAGGTIVSADPAQLLRGAPHRQTAEAFLDFLLSREGQTLHAYRPGAPGGPEKEALRRPPIRRDVYALVEFRQNAVDPDSNPYAIQGSFIYRPELTGPYYSLLRVLLKAIALDPQPELQRAWRAILAAGGPAAVPEAMAAFERLPFSYRDVKAASAAVRRGPNRSGVEVAATVRRWSNEARKNYLEAERLARAARRKGGRP